MVLVLLAVAAIAACEIMAAQVHVAYQTSGNIAVWVSLDGYISMALRLASVLANNSSGFAHDALSKLEAKASANQRWSTNSFILLAVNGISVDCS